MISVLCQGHRLPPTLTVRQAAELAGCGIAAAYQSCRDGRWPALHITQRRIVVCTVPFVALLQLDVMVVDDTTKQDAAEELELPSTDNQEQGSGDPARGHRSVNSIPTKTSDANQKNIPGPRRSRRG